MVMGPACGMVLADLGAQVVKIEPLGGDRTRQLLGAGAGFFPMFNRNKKSLALDLHSAEGRAVAQRLCARADVVIENFKPGTLARMGLDHASLAPLNPRLIYVSHKGFLPGPYQDRTALDEVVQMMGGLAYMTGRPGDPLRAGSSVNDIMGGMFGALGVLAALVQRGITGRGMEVQSALFENNLLLMGQHILQAAITRKPVPPMPARLSPWAVYDVFTLADGGQIFLAVVSDAQWLAFCDVLGLPHWKDDERLRTNNQRVQARDWLLPELRRHVQGLSVAELGQRMAQAGLPYAPIARPEDLPLDPHVQATGALAQVQWPAGRPLALPLLPLLLDGQRPGISLDPPACGQHSTEVLLEAGWSAHEVEGLLARAVVLQA